MMKQREWEMVAHLNLDFGSTSVSSLKETPVM
jgi:hypothetical protein